MSNTELIRTGQDLEEIADLMSKEVQTSQENIVSRYIRVFYDIATFINGQELKYRHTDSNLNKEMMDSGIFTQTSVDDLLPHNLLDVSVARDLQSHRFNFSPKGIELPTEKEMHIEQLPNNILIYDDELRTFTKDHPNTRLTRKLTVEQKIVVNSRGGIAIQSIPFFGIYYSHGYNPIPTNRDITVVCTSDSDLIRLPKLIKYIADPTPEKIIKDAESFSDAFHKLYAISDLKYGSLEEAGIPLSELYDVVMLTGVPVHEIFGHHFEEPIRFLNFGESGTFKYDHLLILMLMAEKEKKEYTSKMVKLSVS